MQWDTPQTSSTQSHRLTPADWNVLASVCVYKFDGDYMQTFTNLCESEYSQSSLVFCLLGKQVVTTATSNQSPSVKKFEEITSFTSHYWLLFCFVSYLLYLVGFKQRSLINQQQEESQLH